jgi:hypothetical protein
MARPRLAMLLQSDTDRQIKSRLLHQAVLGTPRRQRRACADPTTEVVRPRFVAWLSDLFGLTYAGLRQPTLARVFKFVSALHSLDASNNVEKRKGNDYGVIV